MVGLGFVGTDYPGTLMELLVVYESRNAGQEAGEFEIDTPTFKEILNDRSHAWQTSGEDTHTWLEIGP